MLKCIGIPQGAAGITSADSGAKMACRVCHSENMQRLEAELTASLPSLSGLKVPPIYICKNILVCLDCGFAELTIPSTDLLPLKKAKAASGT